MHQSVLEENIGLGFVRFSGGLESTGHSSNPHLSNSISDTYENEVPDDESVSPQEISFRESSNE